MKRKLLFSCAPFLSLAVVSAAVAVMRPTGPALIFALVSMAILAVVTAVVYRRSVNQALLPLTRLRPILDHARRLGIPVPRTADDQVEELFKDLENAFDFMINTNADLENKIRRRREELEASEQRLRRLNSFLDSIVENIPDMIFVKDANELRFVLFNRAGEELIGYPRRDLIGKNDYDLFPKSEADFFTAKDRQVLNRGKAVVIEDEPIHTKNGLKILHTKKIPLLNAEGKPEYLLGISEDVTVRKQNEANLHQRTRELAQAQNEKDQMELFAYVAAHDLREPAHKITSFGDLLNDYLPADGPSRDYLRRMQSAAERMGRLIDDLLKFSKVTRAEIRKETVPLAEVVREVLQDFDLQISRSGARIDVGDLPPVDGGRLQLQEIFRNLIGNALKFCRVDQPPAIRILAETRPEGRIAVSVRDNGIGFEQAYAERIFRPFERLHSRKEFDGSGIGLAICQRMAEQMGAEISAASQPGEGSTFTLTFPAVIARAMTAAAGSEGRP